MKLLYLIFYANKQIQESNAQAQVSLAMNIILDFLRMGRKAHQEGSVWYLSPRANMNWFLFNFNLYYLSVVLQILKIYINVTIFQEE